MSIASLGQTSRFVASATLIMVVLGTATGLLVRDMFVRSLSAQLDAEGILLNRYIAARNVDSILEEDSLTLLDVQLTLVRLMKEIPFLEYGYIKNANGRILAHTFTRPFPPALLSVNRLRGDEPQSIRRIDVGGHVVRDVAVSVAGPGTGEIHLGISERTMAEDLRKVTTGLMGLSAAVFVLYLVLVVFVSRAITRPIRALTGAAERFGTGKLDTRVDVKPVGEVGVLQIAFNRMAANIEQSHNELQDLSFRIESSRQDLQAAYSDLETEVAERKRAQDALSQALREKEVLLKEVHHRVKNNLQALSGLLTLQLYFNRDPGTRSMLTDCCNRLGTMSLIHQSLYESKDVENVQFARYVEHLARQIVESQSDRTHEVDLSLDLEDASLPVDTAMPAGLILNELLTNAFKHAFANGRGGRILVRFASAGPRRYRLTVEDDGRGFPEGFELAKARSMGMQLVRVLTEQLGGTVAISQRPGASLTVEFPEYREAQKLVV